MLNRMDAHTHLEMLYFTYAAIFDWIKNDYPITQRSSRYFKVDFNKNVAKSLNIKMNDSLWLSKDIWEDSNE